MLKQIAAYILGFSVALEGIALLNDPWVQEKFERSIRETARLENRLLYVIDQLILLEPLLGILLIFSGFVIMNNIWLCKKAAQSIIFLHGSIHFNYILLQSERLGGLHSVIPGFLLTLAKIFLVQYCVYVSKSPVQQPVKKTVYFQQSKNQKQNQPVLSDEQQQQLEKSKNSPKEK